MKKRSARGRITRESVMDAALAIADRDGFEGTTIRAIATEVGATPMALYTYFSNKSGLYEGMRDRLFARIIAGSVSRRTWQSMLEATARDLYRTMRDHPNWTPLLAQDSGVPVSGFGFMDGLLDRMLTAGFGVEDAMRAYGSVMSFAVGSALFERMMTGSGDLVTKRLALLKEIVGRTPGRHARLGSVVAKVDRWSWDDVFELGIDSLLTGIDAKHGRSERTARPPPGRK